MKKVTTIVITAISILFLSSCKKVTGEGPILTEDRAINNFAGLSTSISGKVYFTQSANYKVQILAQQNILDVIETYKVGNELVLKFRNNVNVKSHADITVNISAPSLQSLHLSGSANVMVTGDFVSTDFNTSLSGSGNLTIDSMKLANELTTSVSGSGFIRFLSGNAAKAKTFVSGSGNLDLSAVKVNNAISKISGSGSTKLNVLQTLDATISGSGDVYYFGNPLITTHISGSGKVIKL